MTRPTPGRLIEIRTEIATRTAKCVETIPIQYLDWVILAHVLVAEIDGLTAQLDQARAESEHYRRRLVESRAQAGGAEGTI